MMYFLCPPKNDRIVFRTIPFNPYFVKNDENFPQVFIMSLIFANQKLSTKVEYNENDTNLKNRDSVSKNCKSQGETNSCKNCDGEWATFNRA